LRYSKLATVIVGIILSAPILAAGPSTDEVSGVVRAEMQQQHIPGLALLVSKKGKPVLTWG
jgi:CubicO group peptidase (beta-lactamase class C family)